MLIRAAFPGARGGVSYSEAGVKVCAWPGGDLRLLRIRYTLFLLVAAGCLMTAVACGDDSVPTFGTTVVIPSGLRGQVYHIRHNTSHLPKFEKLKPRGTIYSSELNIPTQDFNRGFPGLTNRFEWFAIDYSGRFWISKAAIYEFQLLSDDGARLYIDDQLIVDNDGLHPPEERSGSLQLTRGIHRMRLAYFQGPRFQVALVLKIAGPGEQARVFSTEEFKPPPNPETWQDPETK